MAKLDKIVENSSEKNRNFFIAYLGLLIYVQAIIFSTTDLQLLVFSEGLKLPIIDLTVPLVGFYVVIPIFIIALHFNFLQNLESHHYKLMRWQQAHPDAKVPRSSIYPFLFDYAVLERNGQLLRWVRWANSLLCYNLAPITLGLLLIRFSDQQNILVTGWHYLAFVFDAYLAWKLRLAMKDNQQTETTPDPAHWFLRCWRFYTDSFRHGLRGMFGLFILMETALTLIIGWPNYNGLTRYVLSSIEPIFQYPFTAGEQFFRKPSEWILPRIAINPNETVWKPDVPVLENSAKFSGYSDWVKFFNEKGVGFRPVPDSLRLIQLRAQKLPRTQLSSAQLQSADLAWAQLQGAELKNAQLQGANLSGVQLQGANLLGAQLQGVDLIWAQLQGANLSSIQLKGAALARAQLQGADLSIAQLQGANMWEAQLQGADLRGAQLYGTDLREAHLQGAILYKTAIQYASNIATLEIAVFGIAGQSNLFDKRQQIQDDLEVLAETIPNRWRREQYMERIQQAEKTDQVGIAEQYLRYKPTKIARTVLSEICAQDFWGKNSLLAVQAFRRRYFDLIHYDNGLKQNPDYQALLKDIDRELCTLNDCAYLRKDIEGLDCKAYIKKTNQPH
ncbi:pentapeptide repeat-containing protein [Methylobacter tundripaludum]|uniref:pentapeptide repeat-containing protein n=1 Tax=Methylobacter tundripaludum TaxID=173365 RepID=UPI001363BF2B|nr:pentapeptide repeat-containing protein [Methylobacter tundripaludum]